MKTDKLVQQLTDSYGNWFQSGDCENRPGGTGRMTRNLYPYKDLFSPIQIGKLTIKNRIVMAPMGNCQMAEETGRPNDKMLQYFFARAEGGVGLLTTGLVPISHGIDASITEKGNFSYFPRIDGTRTNFMGWRDLAQGVHARGSRIFIQLTPGLGRVGNPQCLLTKLKLPVSASWNPNFYLPGVPCRPLSDHACSNIIKNAGQGAMDAMVMGLDGVYLHGHEGYLLDQLTSPAFNRRKLGKYADWQRFGVDLIREIRSRTGPNFPIMYRIDLSLALEETYGDRMNTVSSLKKFRGGRSLAETLDYMENLIKAGVDLFDVDLGCYDNWWLPHPPAGMPAGCFLDIAKLAKDHFREKGIRSNLGVEVPVVAVGKLGYPDLAEQALRDGKCDMVMLGRPLLADPDWCNKAYAGQVSEIRPCIGCQEGCVNEFVEGGHPQCAVCGRTGFEELYPKDFPKTDTPKKIAVVGGGCAGLNFALLAAQKGHRVEILEKAAVLGGKLNPAGVPMVKYDLHNYTAWLLSQLASQPGITTKLGVTVTNELLEEGGYDAVVFCNGTREGVPPIPGIEQANYVQATELLQNPQLLGNAKSVVVVGGGAVGVETAYFLSYEKGCQVKVVEMLDQFVDGACTANRCHLIHYLEKNGAQLLNCAKVVSFAPGKVTIRRNLSKTVPDPYVTWSPVLPQNIENPLAPKRKLEEQEQELACDLVVLAMGGKADDQLFLAAQAAQVAPALYNLGDSFGAGRVLEANRAAYHLARII